MTSDDKRKVQKEVAFRGSNGKSPGLVRRESELRAARTKLRQSQGSGLGRFGAAVSRVSEYDPFDKTDEMINVRRAKNAVTRQRAVKTRKKKRPL